MSPLYSHEHIDWNKDWWGTQRLRILCSWGRCFPGCPWRERAKSSPSAKSQHLFQVRFPSDPSPEGQTSLQMSFSLAVIISFLNILYTVIHIPCVQSTAHQQSLQICQEFLKEVPFKTLSVIPLLQPPVLFFLLSLTSCCWLIWKASPVVTFSHLRCEHCTPVPIMHSSFHFISTVHPCIHLYFSVLSTQVFRTSVWQESTLMCLSLPGIWASL